MSKITKAAYTAANNRMEALLDRAAQKGGFAALNSKEAAELDQVTAIVKEYESRHYEIPAPATIAELLSFEMYKRKAKQRVLAAMLGMTETKLSAVLRGKQGLTLREIKAIHQKLKVDANLLLELV
ncbi:MAG: hypothetical protein JST90_19785 [Bacteroidetes bacterium]|nr:hypothetical protein [Bacteroidota bacterium]